jgi:hypothetical protein
MDDWEAHPALRAVRERQEELEAAFEECKHLRSLEFLTAGYDEWRRLQDAANERFDEARRAFNAALAHWKPIKRELQRAEVRRFFLFWRRDGQCPPERR